MGLLDDAIREHLELKRRRGADLGEVAREQREVLDDPLDPAAGQIQDPSSPGAAAAPPLPSDATAPDVLEETAELDMQSVLDQHVDSASVEEVSDATGAGAAVDRAPEIAAQQEPLEWEVPGEGMRRPASEAAVPATGPREAVSGEGVEHVRPPAKDLVAETTDDPHEASEQDRLWLERNAPRDVDLEK